MTGIVRRESTRAADRDRAAGGAPGRGVALGGALDRGFAITADGWVDAAVLAPGTPPPAALTGALGAVAFGEHGKVRLIRDPLGLGKLFWSRGDDGRILVAARPIRLVEAGSRFDDVHAVPMGRCVELDPETGTATAWPVELGPAAPPDPGLRTPGKATHDPPDPIELDVAAPDWPAEPVSVPAGRPEPVPPDLDAVAARIRGEQHRYCRVLAERFGDRRIYVCLSGGLDSTGVLVLAREYFVDVVAVSFDLERARREPSEDRSTARRLARDLGVPLLEVTVGEDVLLEPLDTVIAEGIDWRDFNVHAALVNAALARGIAEEESARGVRVGPAAHPDASSGHAAGPADPAALVFTGDLMNEFLADYHEETHRGVTHYRLPRLPPDRLRSALVRGLETSHREIGVFEAWGLPIVQLYAGAAAALLRLPAAILGTPDAKQRLNRAVHGRRIPDYVYARGKARAQVGDARTGRGVLALCVERGLDEGEFRRRFARLHRADPDAAPGRFIRAGRYRSAVPRWD